MKPTLLLCLGLIACARPAPPRPLADVTLPPLPLWTNKYAATPEEQGTFFNLTELMRVHQLTRLQAAELQNHYRDTLRTTPQADPGAAFDDALRRVRAGELESGVDPDVLAAARFIVVFDLDETLYDQYYPDALASSCHSLAFEQQGRPKHIQLAPGWDAAFATVRSLGGAIVLFSANVDDLTLDNVDHWTWEGKPLRQHPDIGGVFTNSHLTLVDKSEGAPGPVVEPSKDLRLVDPTLTRAILVDDNPKRLVQFANVRVTRKFHADHWCAPDVAPAFQAALGGELVAVAAEIRESVAWWNAHPDASFQQAYLPYTVLGRLAVDALAASNGWSVDEARAWLRDHPDEADAKF